MQAVGNDFVVVEESAWPKGTDWIKQAQRLCDRKFGIGSDGLLLIGPSKSADIRMRMFNPDGTEDMCGNGLRCVIRFAQEHDLFPGERVVVETHDGNHESSRSDSDIWSVCMGIPRFTPQNLPMRIDAGRVLDYSLKIAGEPVTLSVVNTGSTHAVVFGTDLPDDDTFFRLSPQIENNPVFPERTSLIWTRVEPEANTVSVRIWERGVGETLGCGTGALAAAVAAIETQRLPGPTVHVISRGGTLSATWDPNVTGCRLTLSGPAETVYSGSVPAL